MGAFVSALTAYIDALPWLTAAVVLYAVTAGCTVSAIVTTTPLNFMAGPKLGIIAGSLVFNAGATTGSVLNFLIGRFLLRDWAERKLRESATLQNLEAAMANSAVRIVALARLSPVFPFAIVGYALGPTQISLLDFTLGTFIGLMPGCLLYSWIGTSMSDGMSDGGGSGGWLKAIILILSTLAASWQAKRLFDAAVARSQENKARAA